MQSTAVQESWRLTGVLGIDWVGILLLVVGSTYAEAPIDLVVESIEMQMGEAQCCFRKDKSCSDQIFVVRYLREKIRQIKCGFSSGNATKKKHRSKCGDSDKAMWRLLEIFEAGGKLLTDMKNFMCACARVI